MDSSETNTKPANGTTQDPLSPQHQVHSPNEPLIAREDLQPSELPRSGGSRFHEEVAGEQGKNAFNFERPLDVKPTQAGVARGGQEDLPMGKASFLDKVIGKAEKVIGKATHNDDMHEAGELREAGGKKAVIGEAHALHD
ncbi:hypothetical protein BGW80DRAFT_1316406 [Lactifluus volemus]|nr:hypothetical protein BGW80DRAFT_1316406 [Lactifluus volemus]